MYARCNGLRDIAVCTLVVAACCLVTAVSCFADFRRDGPDGVALMLSERIAEPAITAALITVEQLVKSYHMDLAVEELGAILRNSAATSCLDRVIPQCGPVRLCIQAAQLNYQTKLSRVGTDHLATLARMLIDRYASEAEGKDWHAFELLFGPVIINAHRVHDTNTLFAACEQLVAYHPNRDNGVGYLCLITQMGKTTRNTMPLFQRIDQAGNDNEAYYGLLKCRVLRIADKGDESFATVVRWLRRYPNCDPGMLQQTLDFGSALVKEKPADRRKPFMIALMNFALIQPPDAARNYAIALALAEKLKWENTATNSTAAIPPTACRTGVCNRSAGVPPACLSSFTTTISNPTSFPCAPSRS